MPELRKDPFSSRWIVIAPEYAPGIYELGRVGAAVADPLFSRPPASCSLCPENEVHTPPEVYALRPHDGPAAAANSPGWALRVIPHKFPVLRVEGDLSPRAQGVYDHMNGIGAHEVIVETASHDRQMADLSPGEIEPILHAFRQRLLDLRRDTRFRYLSVFKAHGQRAGAGFGHSHSQIIATPFVPQGVLDKIAALHGHRDARKRCLMCDIARQETEDGLRVVHDNGAFVAFTPYASRTPFETWIVPLSHAPMFEDDNGRYGPLATILSVILRKLRAALSDPSYILNLHNAPCADPDNHFHIEIRPVLGRSIPVPWGSGTYVNPTPPEDAARYLREIES